MKVILALTLLFRPFQSASLAVSQKGVSADHSSYPSLETVDLLLKRHQYAQAVLNLQHLVKVNGGSPKVFFLLGVAQSKLGDMSRAESDFRRSIGLNPHSSAALYNLGVLLLSEGRPSESLELFQRSVDYGPLTPALVVNLVRAALGAGRAALALRVVKTSGTKFTADPPFDLALGQVLLSFGRPGKARPFLQMANHLVPGRAEVALPLAKVCLQERDTACASSALRSVASTAEGIGEYHYLLGKLDFLQGMQGPGIAEIQRAAQLRPMNIDYLLTLGRFYQTVGNENEALRVFTQAEQLSPGSAQIPYFIGVTYFFKNNFGLSATYAEDALLLDAHMDAAFFLLALSRFATANLHQAGTAFKRAMALRPQSPFYACFYGMLLAAQGRTEAAIAYFRKSVAIDPTFALPYCKLGGLMESKQNYDAARANLELAIKLDPNLVEPYYRLSHVYWRLGEQTKARQALATFLKLKAARYSAREEMLREMHQALR